MTEIAMSGAKATPRPRPAISRIDPYVPGESAAPGSPKVFKLSANETPLGPSPRAREALRVFADRLQNYPDGAATALREAHEEVGLDASFVEPLGYLDAYRTGTGFCIFPVVALVRSEFELALDAREVAEAFEVPLAFLMDESNHTTHVRAWRGRERRFYAMPFEQRYIWGATAGIIKNMHQRLFPA